MVRHCAVPHAAVGAAVANPTPMPTYFISHGGPTFMYRDGGNQGAYDAIKRLGAHITDLQPDYIIVVSAHWQSSMPSSVEIATPGATSVHLDPTENELIYDFYGFPRHMYREQFHTQLSPLLAALIKQRLDQGGRFAATLTPRGIDHGVWVPLKVAFGDARRGQWDLAPKLVQVSLLANAADFDAHFALGQALDYFRHNNVWDPLQQRHLRGLVVCLGMTVHNLHHLHLLLQGAEAPYTRAFGDLLSRAVLRRADARLAALKQLQSHHAALLRQAHPTLEHLVPLVVAAGVAGNDTATELYNAYEGPLGWGIYEFK